MNPAGVIMRVLIVLRSESHWQLIFLCETATLARCLAGDVSPRQVSFLSLILLFTMYWPTSSSYLGLPWWLSGKESPYERRRPRFEPWVRKISWRRKWQPTLAWRVSWTKELTLPAHWELWQMHGLWVSPDLISAASLQQSLCFFHLNSSEKKKFFFFHLCFRSEMMVLWVGCSSVHSWLNQLGTGGTGSCDRKDGPAVPGNRSVSNEVSLKGVVGEHILWLAPLEYTLS